MAKLTSSLVLYKYILSLFGVTDFTALSSDLKDSLLEGYDENNISHFYNTLITRFYGNRNLPQEILLQYDQNIYSHTTAISEKREKPITWKYFQYLSLLFSEIYLDKYFRDRNNLKEELNIFLQTANGRNANDFGSVSEYLISDGINELNKVAFWNATGSGKTLIMHVNILQYKHYLKLHNKEKELNRVIVLTPNEGLSRQHLKEFIDSGFEAELFEKDGASLFAGQKVEIIDIHKLEETSGDKTVAIESFEDKNLVLVDEGHRGSGGEIWKDKRNRICENGFSFEYSATFGQAVHAQTGAKQKALLNEYGKATIFDYSYKYFYEDGYGKDYQILNLNQNWNEDYVELYLTACLVSFYEQLYLYKDEEKEIEPFLIDKPLAIFVGGKVTKTINAAIASDVVEVLKFFGKFIKNEEGKTTEKLQRILEDRTGLNNDIGQSIFKNAFKYIKSSGLSADELFEEMIKEIFNSEVAGAVLHLDNLKGQDGEIGLRAGNGDYFGVINVGDDKGLLKICKEHQLSVDERDFSNSLFHDINEKHSKINILIGSKKFTEGWSSWRVSTMGLLNVGRGEGTEIIQLFGRGVRLKGYKFSLKRSTELDITIKPDYIPEVLPLLETLNIFGLRADYMQQFKEYLEEEGLPTGTEFVKITVDILPTIANLSEKKLKYIRVKEGYNFKKDIVVDVEFSDKVKNVLVDWYPKLQILKSSNTTNITAIVTIEEGKLEARHLAFADWQKIYFEIQKYKNERSWYNMNVSLNSIREILTNFDWYTLQIPSAELELTDYSRVKLWQEIAIVLLKQYIDKLYNYHKNKYYSDKLEIAIMDITHPNFEDEYKFLVKKDEDALISKIKELKDKVQRNDFNENFKVSNDFEALYASMHLYQPLIYIEKKIYEEIVKLQPVQLNEGERNFVEDIKLYYEKSPEFFKDKELYLLRNISKRGIGFFEANNFFPDFILWLIIDKKQYIAFIDPKGLRQVQGFSDKKIQLFKTIKTDIQVRLNDKDIELSSFIVSNTEYKHIKHWKGQDTIDDFNTYNVYFQKDQRDYYIKEILDKLSI